MTTKIPIDSDMQSILSIMAQEKNESVEQLVQRILLETIRNHTTKNPAKPKKSLADAFMSSPVKIDLDIERIKDYGRDIQL